MLGPKKKDRGRFPVFLRANYREIKDPRCHFRSLVKALLAQIKLTHISTLVSQPLSFSLGLFSPFFQGLVTKLGDSKEDLTSKEPLKIKEIGKETLKREIRSRSNSKSKDGAGKK